jgi:hypothetical protein
MSSPARENAPAWGLAVSMLASLLALSLASCKDQAKGNAPDASASASASADAAASAAASAMPDIPPESPGDSIRPVYPIDNKPPLPLAERYCNAVRELPKKRRQECCPAMGMFAPTGECIRTLSSALRAGSVTLDTADLDACVTAVTNETTGCDWVTSVEGRTAAACLGIIKGVRKDGEVCRSNLECQEGSRCLALGATRPGQCGPPLPARLMCNVATDSLAAFSGQDDFDRHHPECEGYCSRRQCAEATALGAACTGSLQCGRKALCIAGKCSDAAPPSPGQACTDVCAAGAHCSKGKCVAVKADGESCTEDAECRAQCERADGGKVGQCRKQCPSLAKPKVLPSTK